MNNIKAYRAILSYYLVLSGVNYSLWAQPSISEINGGSSGSDPFYSVLLVDGSSSDWYSWSNRDKFTQYAAVHIEHPPKSVRVGSRQLFSFTTQHAHIWTFRDGLHSSLGLRTIPTLSSMVSGDYTPAQSLGISGSTSAVLPLYDDSNPDIWYTDIGKFDLGLLKPGKDGYNQLSSIGKAQVFRGDILGLTPSHWFNGYFVAPNDPNWDAIVTNTPVTVVQEGAGWDPAQMAYEAQIDDTQYWRQRHFGMFGMLNINNDAVLVLYHGEQANQVGYRQLRLPGYVGLHAYSNYYPAPQGNFVVNYKYTNLFTKYGFNMKSYWGEMYPEINVFDGNTFGSGGAFAPQIAGNAVWVEGESWNAYSTYVGLAIMNLDSNKQVLNVVDYGPVVWPRDGYFTEINRAEKRYDQITFGPWLPTMVRNGNFLYLIYSDNGGNSFRVARSNISNALNHAGHFTGGNQPFTNFLLYSHKAGTTPFFLVNATPPGFMAWNEAVNSVTTVQTLVDFMSTPLAGGLSFTLNHQSFSKSGWDFRKNFYQEDYQIGHNNEYKKFEAAWVYAESSSSNMEPLPYVSVAKIKNTPYYILAQAHILEESNVWVYDWKTDESYQPSFVTPTMKSTVIMLHISSNLVDWSEGKVIPVPPFTAFNYPLFMDKNGHGNLEIDADDFYLLGAGADAEHIVRLRLGINIAQ